MYYIIILVLGISLTKVYSLAPNSHCELEKGLMQGKTPKSSVSGPPTKYKEYSIDKIMTLISKVQNDKCQLLEILKDIFKKIQNMEVLKKIITMANELGYLNKLWSSPINILREISMLAIVMSMDSKELLKLKRNMSNPLQIRSDLDVEVIVKAAIKLFPQYPDITAQIMKEHIKKVMSRAELFKQDEIQEILKEEPQIIGWLSLQELSRCYEMLGSKGHHLTDIIVSCEWFPSSKDIELLCQAPKQFAPWVRLDYLDQFSMEKIFRCLSRLKLSPQETMMILTILAGDKGLKYQVCLMAITQHPEVTSVLTTNHYEDLCSELSTSRVSIGIKVAQQLKILNDAYLAWTARGSSSCIDASLCIGEGPLWDRPQSIEVVGEFINELTGDPSFYTHKHSLVINLDMALPIQIIKVMFNKGYPLEELWKLEKNRKFIFNSLFTTKEFEILHHIFESHPQLMAQWNQTEFRDQRFSMLKRKVKEVSASSPTLAVNDSIKDDLARMVILGIGEHGFSCQELIDLTIQEGAIQIILESCQKDSWGSLNGVRDRVVRQLNPFRETLEQELSKLENEKCLKEVLVTEFTQPEYQEKFQALIDKRAQRTRQGSYDENFYPLHEEDTVIVKVIHKKQAQGLAVESYFTDYYQSVYLLSALMAQGYFEEVKSLLKKNLRLKQNLDVVMLYKLHKNQAFESKIDDLLNWLVQENGHNLRFFIFYEDHRNPKRIMENNELTLVFESLKMLQKWGIQPSLYVFPQETLLTSLIISMFLGCHNIDPLIKHLISLNIDCYTGTVFGDPLTHILYYGSANQMFSSKNPDEGVVAMAQKLIEGYHPDQKFHLVLNPEEAEFIHEKYDDITPGRYREYGETPVMCTLIFDVYSQEAYDLVKERCPLTHRNKFERNFVHQLAMLDVCLEPKLAPLLQRRCSPQEAKQLCNQPDLDQMTPLMYAVSNPEFFKQLLDYDCDQTCTDRRGWSVFHHLLFRGAPQSLWIWAQHNADDLQKKTLWKEEYSMDWSQLSEEQKATFDMELRTILFKRYCEKNPYQGVNLLQQYQQIRATPREEHTSHPRFKLLPDDSYNMEEQLKKWQKELEETQRQETIKAFKASPNFQKFSTGGRSGDSFQGPKVIQGYQLEDPVEICQHYGYSVPDLRSPIMLHGSLCDGFRLTFEKALETYPWKNSEQPEALASYIEDHAKTWMLARQYLLAWSMSILVQDPPATHSVRREFAKAFWSFFQDKQASFPAPIQEVLAQSSLVNGQVHLPWDIFTQHINDDETGALFPWVYYLPLREARICEDKIRAEYGPLPEYERQYNIKRRVRMALIKTLLKDTAQPEVSKVQEFQDGVDKVHQELQRNSVRVDTLEDIAYQGFGLEPEEEGDSKQWEAELKQELQNLKFHGRIASFFHRGKEYLIKVATQGEDIRDAAVIRYLQNVDSNFTDEKVYGQFGRVCIATLSDDLAQTLRKQLCNVATNPRMKYQETDLTTTVHLIEVNHQKYFDYITKPEHSFDTLKEGLAKAMEQLFYQAKEHGCWMTALSDIAHAPGRKEIFCPLTKGLTFARGDRGGAVLELAKTVPICDVSSKGPRDPGNALNLKDIDSTAGLNAGFKREKEAYQQYMEKQGRHDELQEQNVNESIQECLMVYTTTPIFFLLNYFIVHPEERERLSVDKWLNFIEETTFKPLCKHFVPYAYERCRGILNLCKERLRNDFERFKAEPELINEVFLVPGQSEPSRDLPFQSFYEFGLLCWTQVKSTVLWDKTEPPVDSSENQSITPVRLASATYQSVTHERVSIFT